MKNIATILPVFRSKYVTALSKRQHTTCYFTAYAFKNCSAHTAYISVSCDYMVLVLVLIGPLLFRNANVNDLPVVIAANQAKLLPPNPRR